MIYFWIIHAILIILCLIVAREHAIKELELIDLKRRQELIYSPHCMGALIVNLLLLLIPGINIFFFLLKYYNDKKIKHRWKPSFLNIDPVKFTKKVTGYRGIHLITKKDIKKS